MEIKFRYIFKTLYVLESVLLPQVTDYFISQVSLSVRLLSEKAHDTAAPILACDVLFLLTLLMNSISLIENGANVFILIRCTTKSWPSCGKRPNR